MIIHVEKISELTGRKYERLFEQMPKERQQRVLRYVKEKDRTLSVLAFDLLISTLKEAGFDAKVEFEHNVHGKPYFKDIPLYFSLSHTDGAVAVVISENEVGIDIQKTAESYQKIAKKVCSECELQVINESDEPEKVFTTLWTLKESYLKCIGTGINRNLKELDFCGYEERFEKYGHCFEIRHTDGYTVSISERKEGKA